MVFIIGSGSPEFKEDVDAIGGILNGFGLEGYFALLSEEEKGLDAFCDKICSKIIESQFCVVMLNDPVVDRNVEEILDRFEKVRAPSANVYYEFGMAVALRKSIIPVVRSGFRLPFDVQHLDAIHYDGVNDLTKKLRSSIRATLKKKTKEVAPANIELVKLVYGPLYNGIDRFLSRRDKFATFSPSEYSRILTQHKYVLDTIDATILKDVMSFHGKLEEFNSSIKAAERIINQIVVEEISDFLKIPAHGSLSISIGLETDTGHISPTLGQILLRKTTPELYLQATGAFGTIKRITYTLRTPEHTEKEIDPNLFGLFYRKCRDKVESNSNIQQMRALQTALEYEGKALKEKLKQFCR